MFRSFSINNRLTKFLIRLMLLVNEDLKFLTFCFNLQTIWLLLKFWFWFIKNISTGFPISHHWVNFSRLFRHRNFQASEPDLRRQEDLADSWQSHGCDEVVKRVEDNPVIVARILITSFLLVWSPTKQYKNTDLDEQLLARQV